MNSEKPYTAQGPNTIVLATPRGFCAGVDRAVEIVERALLKYGRPVYVKHAIVHNRHVVERLSGLGALFVEALSDVPRGMPTIFSAHGVSPAVHDEARQKGLLVIDATCPLVTRVHIEAQRHAEAGRTIFLIGHRNHVEVQGTLGEAPQRIVVVENIAEAETVAAEDPEQVAYLTQTTLSVDDTSEIVRVLKRRFPALSSPRKGDICYATQNRQNAVKALVENVDAILVVGAEESSNSNRLVEVAHSYGTPAYLVESKHGIDHGWLAKVEVLGVTAGASAPEDIVQDLVDSIKTRYEATVRNLEVASEDTTFPLPPILLERAKGA